MTPASSPCWRQRTSDGWPTVTSRTPGRPTPSPYWFPAVAGRRGGDPRAPRGHDPGGAGTLRHGHDDAHRRRHLGRRQGGQRRRGDVRRPRAGRVAALPTRSAGPRVTTPGQASSAGSCYLNNAAVAAARLRRGGAARVAVVDIDAHHGNGTQACFWDDPARVLRLRARRPRRRVVPAHRRLRGRGRCLRDAPATSRLAGHRRRRLARPRSIGCWRRSAASSPKLSWCRSASTPPRKIPTARSRSRTRASQRRAAIGRPGPADRARPRGRVRARDPGRSHARRARGLLT